MKVAYAITEKTTTRPEGKEKIYITGHEEDRQWSRVLTKELLHVLDGKVHVLLQQLSEEEWEEHLYHLSNMNLVVVLVTRRFLEERNDAKEREFTFAREQGIPVLPIMLEEGVEELFDKLCGEMHLLNRGRTDYTEKLKEYLEFLFGDGDLRAQVNKAFGGRIFLSYRKKDYKSAMQLIRKIHGLAGCEDTAIWYDDYLKFGEDYNEEIAYYLKNSDLMVLNVTPNLLEPKNYVMRVEYPMAVNEGKVVIPVGTVGSTEKTRELEHDYPGLRAPVQCNDLETLREVIMEVIPRADISEAGISTEKKYFLGEAYFNGIQVEIDRVRGLTLMEEAAEAGVIRAMFRLGMLYKTGFGVKRDLRKARIWFEKNVNALEERMNTQDNALCAVSRALAISLLNLSDIYMARGYTNEAQATLQRLEQVSIYNVSKGFIGTATNPGTVHLRQGMLEAEAGNYKWAADEYTAAEPLLQEIWKGCHTIQAGKNYALLRERQSELELIEFERKKDVSLLKQAVKYLEEAVEVQKWVAENGDETCEVEKYLIFAVEFGVNCDKLGMMTQDIAERCECYDKGVAIFDSLRKRQDLSEERCWKVDYNYCLFVLRAGSCKESIGDIRKARELYREAYLAYAEFCQVPGQGTPNAYMGLANACINLAVAGLNPPDRDLLKQAYDILEELCRLVPDVQEVHSLRAATLYRLQIWPATI